MSRTILIASKMRIETNFAGRTFGTVNKNLHYDNRSEEFSYFFFFFPNGEDGKARVWK